MSEENKGVSKVKSSDEGMKRSEREMRCERVMKKKGGK